MSEKIQDVKKSIENVVDQILEQEKTESVEKSMPTSVPENGGKDEIKSGSPHTEEQNMMSEKKEEAKKSETEEEKKEEDSVEKAKKDDKKDEKKKDDDCDKDDMKDKKDKKPAFMKKSIEELSNVLDEEELELIKAWREEAAPEAEEEITKSETVVEAKAEDKSEDLAKSLSKAIAEAVEPLKKSLDEKDSLIKSMSEKLEKMASQPAYERRSISSLETLEKSNAENGVQELSKSQIAEKMLQMQLAGKGVNSHHIAEFEATGNISDAAVKALVFKELKLN